MENHDLSGLLTEQVLTHHRSLIKKTDIVALERLRYCYFRFLFAFLALRKHLFYRTTLNTRIDSIKRVIGSRENDTAEMHPLSEPQVRKQMPRHFVQPPNNSSPHEGVLLTSASWCEESTAGMAEPKIRPESPSIFTLVNDSDVSGGSRSNPIASSACDDHDQPMAPSEADYWLGIEEVPMEDEQQVDVPAAIAPLPIAATSSATSPGSPTDSPYYPEIVQQLKYAFGLADFRPNQLEAITETLAGRDVFVLMPTGGGKSLCYQLPAICKTGKTKGVTVVVSPLLALMKDQVHTLMKRNINVFLWNSEASWDDALHHIRAGPKPSLMYITPEKLKESSAAQSILAELYRKKELARFVVDEAHCISTWGQDFRDAVSSMPSSKRLVVFTRCLVSRPEQPSHAISQCSDHGLDCDC